MEKNKILCEFYSYEEAVNKTTGQIYGILKVVYCDVIVKMFIPNSTLNTKFKDIKRYTAMSLTVEIKVNSNDQFILVPFDVEF